MPDLVGASTTVEGTLDVDGVLSQATDVVLDESSSERVVAYDDTTAPPTSGKPAGTVFVGYDADG